MGIKHDKTAQKFYIDLGNKEEALLAYMIVNDIMDIHRTFVPESHRGEGLAEKLARKAFEYAKKKKLKVIATCDYVKNKFLERHQEYKKMVTDNYF